MKQSAQLVGDFHKKNMKFEETLGDVGLSLIHGLEIHSLINGVTRPRKGLKYFWIHVYLTPTEGVPLGIRILVFFNPSGFFSNSERNWEHRIGSKTRIMELPDREEGLKTSLGV